MKLPPSRTWYGLALRVDRLLRQLLERALEVVDRERHVAIARAQVVPAAAVVERQLQLASWPPIPKK